MDEQEGVIKYHLDFQPGALAGDAPVEDLCRWFARCRERGLIGRDPDRYHGLAYGNISARAGTGFVVSGTQTGGRETLGAGDLAWVTGFDLEANRLAAQGPVRPSSESLTHALVYRTRGDVNAVIHGHVPVIWGQAGALALDATPEEAAYGTPAMAAAVAGLLAADPRRLPGVLVMGGHQDGVIAYGADLESAGRCLLDLLDRAEALAGARAAADRS